jgi:cytochrome c oxidase assembly protein subunit 11
VNDNSVDKRNTKLVRILVLVVVGMFGFGFALVPLYNVLCEVTGLNGKVNKEAAKEERFQIDASREITVQFLTIVNESSPMKFGSQIKEIKVHPGQYYNVSFYAENLTDKDMVARAIPSISPGLTAEYFIKTECFCFSEQTFKPRENKTMPVRFVVNPKIPADYKTITLAYTFFDNTASATAPK